MIFKQVCDKSIIFNEKMKKYKLYIIILWHVVKNIRAYFNKKNYIIH
jgi:hypothetical protein